MKKQASTVTQFAKSPPRVLRPNIKQRVLHFESVQLQLIGHIGEKWWPHMSVQCTMNYHSVHKQVNCTTTSVIALGSLHLLAQFSNVQCNDLGWQVCSLVPSSEKLAKQNIQHWSSVTEHTMLNTLSLIFSKTSQNTYYTPQNCPGSNRTQQLLAQNTFHQEKSFTDSEKLFAELSSPSFNNYIAFWISTPANTLE